MISHSIYVCCGGCRCCRHCEFGVRISIIIIIIIPINPLCRFIRTILTLFACTSANQEKSPSKSWTVDDRIDLFTYAIRICPNDVMPWRNLRIYTFYVVFLFAPFVSAIDAHARTRAWPIQTLDFSSSLWLSPLLFLPPSFWLFFSVLFGCFSVIKFNKCWCAI